MHQDIMIMQDSEGGLPVCIDAWGKLDRLFALLETEREVAIEDTHYFQD